MRARVRRIAPVVALAALYVVVARLGLSLGAVAGFATLVWPPTGISIAALLILGNRAWPGVLIGAIAANLLTGASVPVALGIGLGNTAEALVCADLVKRVPRFSLTLENVRTATSLIFASLVGTAISAVVGVASLFGAGSVQASQLAEAWRAWWVGDMVGALVVAPVILVWSKPAAARFASMRGEAVGLAVATVLVGAATFFTGVPAVSGVPTRFHTAYLLLAVLVWAALRFGQRGAATTTFVISAAAVTATVLGHGPFVHGSLSVSLMSLQTFMAIVAVTFLLFGATIDERRCTLEFARHAYRAAARANRTKSEFLAVMSHELRTPLNAIAGYAQLLEEGVRGPLNLEQADYVRRIHRNEERLLSLIDEVLGFVRAEKGQLAVRREPIRVSDAFDAVQPLVASQLEEHHCVLKRDTIGSRLAVRADPTSLQQILVGLLSNASKYSPDGGTVTLGAERQGDNVRIWVRDTGIGIRQKELEKVFQPFFQAERTTTRRFADIGLGLTIARNLARQMKGEVTLSSTPGTGTTASVSLPAA